MTKSIILSMLLVLVYQFDELMHMLAVFMKRFKNKRVDLIARNADHYVGTALTIALMPLTINYIFISGWSLPTKLLVLFLTYMAFAIAAFGVSQIVYEMERAQRYGGVITFFAAAQLVGGFFFPVVHQVPWHAGRERLTYSKLAFLLSLPPLLGLIFLQIYDSYLYGREFMEFIDILIIVMVGGLFINLTVHALEKYFARANLSAWGYYRIVLGLALGAYMII